MIEDELIAAIETTTVRRSLSGRIETTWDVCCELDLDCRGSQPNWRPQQYRKLGQSIGADSLYLQMQAGRDLWLAEQRLRASLAAIEPAVARRPD